MDTSTDIYKEIQVANMVSRSCIKLVQVYFEHIDGIQIRSVRLGHASYDYCSTTIHPRQIEVHFEKIGFKVLKDQNNKMAEQIKTAAIELIHWSNNTNSLIRNSDYIADKIGEPYNKLSRIFSDTFHITLEKYIILLKIEKVKRMIIEGNYTLSEISYYMGYSSVNYLSGQFKKITGETVSKFKRTANKFNLTPLEDII